MTRLPFGLRVAAGITVAAAERARTLPRKLLGLPVTVLSETLQLSMRVQQQVTELAIRGDTALAAWRPVERAPSWATFDEDLLDEQAGEPGGGAGASELAALQADLRRLDEHGASALNGAGGESPWDAAARDLDPAGAPDTAGGTAPDGGDEDPWQQEQRALAQPHTTGTFDTVTEPALPTAFPNYPELSLPQLRARLRRFSVDDLTELLDYELATANRQEYVRMLRNRIETVRPDRE